MLAEGHIHHTEFPQNPVSPLSLYTALHASRVETIIQKGLPNMSEDKTIVNIVEEFNVYPGSIQRRNAEYREVYFCGPLTSAGAIRIPDNQESPFRQNVVVAETFRDALIPRLTGESEGLRVHLTIPSHVGLRETHRRGWEEGDYNLFWLYYLSGINPDVALHFDKKKSTKESLMKINRKKENRDQHKFGYLEMVDDFIALVNDPSAGCWPNKMSRMVTLPDSQRSFGSQMEIRLAKGIGIPVDEARVNPDWIKTQQHLWFNKHINLLQLDGVDFVLPVDLHANQISLVRI